MNWFDVEMKTVFGIDVFSSEFPKSMGYEIFRGHYADVLLIRLENLNECWNEACGEFLNTEFAPLYKENVGQEKGYQTAYRNFIDSIKIPETHIERMYKSRYMQHFYSNEDINYFKQKWGK